MPATRPGACRVCQHPDRIRVEAALANGESLRVVGARFNLEKDALNRHHRNHITPERRGALMLGPGRMESLANEAAAESRTLLERMDVATSVLFSRLVACAEAEDDDGVSKIAGKLNILFRQFAELTGQLRQAASVTINNNTVNLIASPEFVRLQKGLLAIARAHPSIKPEIVGLLRSLEERPPAPTPDLPPLIEARANVA